MHLFGIVSYWVFIYWGDDAGSTEVIAANKAAEYALDTVVSQLQKKGLR